MVSTFMGKDAAHDHLSTFITLVAGPTTPPEALQGDIVATYERLGLSSEGTYTAEAVRKYLGTKIRAALSHPDGDWDSARLRTMERELIMRHELDALPLQPTLRMLEQIGAATKDVRFPRPEDVAQWRTAIQAARDLLVVDVDPGIMKLPIEAFRPREVNVGRGAAVLRVRGANISIRDAQVQLNDDDARSIALEILHAIERLGGLQFASAVFRMLPYDGVQMRYHLAPSTSTTSNYRSSSIPFGYLLQLAVRAAKHAPSKGVPPDVAPALFEDIFALSTALVAAYDVERYNPWEAAFQSASTILPFARRLVIAYGSFSLVQMRPADVGRMLRGVFDWVDDEETVSRCGFSFRNAICVAETILETAKDTRGPVAFSRDQIVATVPPEVRGDIDRILAVFTHVDSANQDFLLPEEATKETFGSRPLIRDRDGDSILLDASWCAPAFYEALATALRDQFGPVIDERVGLATERFLQREFEARKIAVTRGPYVARGEHGECDGVFESESHVVFYEVKKKALRRASRAGSEIDLIIDLSKSLIATQVQLGNHEIRLLEQSYLEIDDQGGRKVILLSDREVERFALTLQDYGLLQDRLVIDRLLRIVTGSKFTVAPESLQSKLDDLTELSQELLEQYNRITAFDEARVEQPFFNCWFLSVPQLLVVLDGVDSPDAFWERIKSVRHLITGRLDFYADLAFAESIRRS